MPRAFVDLAQSAILHRDPQRFALLYALLIQLRDRPGTMEDKADPLLRRIEGLAKAVRRDIHKMRAFVRFRALGAAIVRIVRRRDRERTQISSFLSGARKKSLEGIPRVLG